MHTISKKGFTLVELLIVIGILAVLATTAVVILNPAQLLAQARDSQRLSDLGSLQAALALYAADVTLSLQDMDVPDAVNTVFCASTRASTAKAWVSATTAPTTDSFTGTTNVLAAAGAAGRVTTGTGWLPVNIALVESGSPLPILPVDPTNSGNLMYRYACDNPTAGTTPANYELNACLESTKYMPYMDVDGGNKNSSGTNACSTPRFYEVGTDSGLDL